jgi:hypothetical protein
MFRLPASLLQQEINIKLGSKSPSEYFSHLFDQVESGGLKYGGIESMSELKSNLAVNCIPDIALHGDIHAYDSFLVERRIMMAAKIREYYYSL